MDKCNICGADLYAGMITTMKPTVCWNCANNIIEDQESWLKSLPGTMQKESEIIIANAGLIIPFLRCKKPFKLKGKLKRKDFLKLTAKNK